MVPAFVLGALGDEKPGPALWGRAAARDGLFRGTRIKFSKTCDWEIGGQPPTKFGGRQRPHFVIHSWISLPSEEARTAALPAPTPAITGESITLDAVEPVSLAEEMSDSIPF